MAGFGSGEEFGETVGMAGFLGALEGGGVGRVGLGVLDTRWRRGQYQAFGFCCCFSLALWFDR